jgi:lysophospholipase L1-like esterase
MNRRHASIPQSVCHFALVAICGAMLTTSVVSGQGKAETTIMEDVRKIPDLEFWVSAEDLSGGEGVAVTKWPDRTSHHWDLAAAGGTHTLTLKAINGRPAVWFDGKQNGKDSGPFGPMLTEAKFFDASWDGAISVFMVARQDIDPGPEFHQVAFWTADAPAARDKIAGLMYGNRDQFWSNVHYAKDLFHCQCGYPLDVNIYGISYDRAMLTTWINCVEFDNIPIQGNPELRGPFCLGNNVVWHNGFAQFGGYIAEVLVYKRGLSLAECQAVNRYLQRRYGLTGRQIVLEGHSQFNTLVPQLERRLPGWAVNNAAIGGTAMHVWVSQTRKFAAALRPGVKNIIIAAGGDNDLGRSEGQVETAEANYKTWALTLRAMGWKTIVSCTPPRSPNAAYPLYAAHREKFNAWLRANYKTFADGLYDIDVIPALADAANSTYYKPDGVHLTLAGYELTADEIAKAVTSVAGGERESMNSASKDP